MTPQENRHVRRGNFSLSVKQLIEKALHGGAVFLQVICLLRHKTYLLLLVLRVYIESLHKSRRKRNPNQITDYFVCTAMHVRGCHVLRASLNQRVPYGKTQDL